MKSKQRLTLGLRSGALLNWRPRLPTFTCHKLWWELLDWRQFGDSYLPVVGCYPFSLGHKYKNSAFIWIKRNQQDHLRLKLCAVYAPFGPYGPSLLLFLRNIPITHATASNLSLNCLQCCFFPPLEFLIVLTLAGTQLLGWAGRGREVNS